MILEEIENSVQCRDQAAEESYSRRCRLEATPDIPHAANTAKEALEQRERLKAKKESERRRIAECE